VTRRAPPKASPAPFKGDTKGPPAAPGGWVATTTSTSRSPRRHTEGGRIRPRERTDRTADRAASTAAARAAGSNHPDSRSEGSTRASSGSTGSTASIGMRALQRRLRPGWTALARAPDPCLDLQGPVRSAGPGAAG
jgi:hypothetical protein